MSTFSPFPFSDFSGLDIASDPDESGCIDMLNVDLDKRGSVRSRDGFSKFNAVANPSALSRPFAWLAQQSIVASGADLKVYVYAAGALTSTSSALSDRLSSVAAFGTGTTSYLYLAQGSGNPVYRLTTGGTFSSPAGMPTAQYLAVQPSDNRLVVGRVGTALGRVQFSDPGDAETWGANNYVDLTPNDGDTIVALAAWQNLLFAFKQHKFFVFYGNSVDGSGNPVFNYRTVDVGIGSFPLSAPVATPRGLVFVGPKGVFLTTGGVPQKLSGPIEPIFTSASSFASPISPGSLSVTAMTYVRNAVYITSANYILKYDMDTGGWAIWQLAGAALQGVCAYTIASVDEQVCVTRGTAIYTQPYVSGQTVTTDDGTAITSRYRSAFTPLNWIRRSGHWYPIGSQEATVRESVIDGTGTIKYSLSRDFGAIPTTGGGAKATITLGTSPAVSQGRHTIAQQGRRVSFQIEDDGTGSAWRVYDLTMHIDDARYPGIETS